MKIDVKGIDGVNRRLKAVRERLLNLQPVLAIAGEELKAVALQSFDKKQDPSTGRQWAPLKPATVAKKAKAGRPFMLVWSGDMRKSISARATKNTVTIGASVPYAGAHQKGTEFMEARPFLPLGKFPSPSSDTYKAYVRIKRRIQKYVVTGQL